VRILERAEAAVILNGIQIGERELGEWVAERRAGDLAFRVLPVDPNQCGLLCGAFKIVSLVDRRATQRQMSGRKRPPAAERNDGEIPHIARSAVAAKPPGRPASLFHHARVAGPQMFSERGASATARRIWCRCGHRGPKILTGHDAGLVWLQRQITSRPAWTRFRGGNMGLQFHRLQFQRVQFHSGDRVRIETGDYAGKLGIVVARRSISYTHTRKGSIPNIEGASGPLGINDLLVRLDNGKIVAIVKDRLSKILVGEYPLTLRVA
jgi:hypothetical protein